MLKNDNVIMRKFEINAYSFEQAKENMEELADLVINDCGCFCKGLESTVVGVFEDDVKVFRQGAIKIELD